MDRLDEIRKRTKKAFKGPWTYSDWSVDCEAEDHCGNDHDALTIEAPEEYPDGQVVAQITHVCDVPGLEDFARDNGAFIAHARTDIPFLLERVEVLEKALRAVLHWYEVDSSEFNREMAIGECRAALSEPSDG